MLYGLSQKELSEGICTQAYISKVEAGNVNIASDILYQLTERLGVDPNYFLFSSYNDKFDYMLEVEKQARLLVEEKDYESLRNLIKAEENSPLIKFHYFKQLIIWHKGICIRYIDNDLDKALNLLYQSLKLSKTSHKTISQREVQIFSNIGSVLSEKKDYPAAISTYESTISKLKTIPNYDINVETSLLYNLSRAYLLNNEVEKSLENSRKVIQLCERHLLIQGLGHSYFIQGHCYKELGKLDQAKESFEKAKNTFDLTNQKSYLAKVVNQLNKL
ncbi:helix-turn-helix domain-containing protein [Alkalibacillus aidingensis]|uniref:helix-turn-helix domain-containing protein n=1 Tax=Alkalibacillus aidingensis TaxID=2747607 RepID=UPI0016616681|nr:helix-turn-helix domain-containing protein [Alkalibacillus aidingensis]